MNFHTRTRTAGRPRPARKDTRHYNWLRTKAFGVDAREKLTVLATCKIDLESVRVLIAARGSGAHMIAVRAPGNADEQNLYCLVGVMGSDRLRIHSEGIGVATRATWWPAWFHAH